MQFIFLFLLMLISAPQLLAQGTITGISVFPPNPTSGDDIELHIDVQFTSGDCQVDNKDHNTNAFAITAYAHHCFGLLTVICPTTDTFQLGQLPAGDYTVDFTLTSGFGGPNCSPGIIPEDTEQFQFTVSTSVGIQEIQTEAEFIYPNPVSNILFFENKLNHAVTITDIRGNTVVNVKSGARNVDISHLPSGLYFLQTETKRFRIIKD
ncbi:T9SS type A sorting domain-containing protein [Flavobacteriales bacterium]|nr:T9SS type A sorting domain-containing protein [Flavobacteriales bacterium]